MKSTLANTDRATILSVGHEDGRNAVAAVPSDLAAPESPVASQAARVIAAMGPFNDAVAGNAARFQTEARNAANREAAAKILPAPVQALIAAGIAEGRAIAAAYANASAVDPGNAPLRAQVRDRYDAMTDGQRSAFTQRASLEELAAFMEAGRAHFPNMSDRDWQDVEDNYIMKRHIARSGLQANFQRKPDVNDPLAFGPDENAAMNAARNSLKALRARPATVDAVRNTVQSIIDVVAIATDLSPDDAWKLLTTGKAA